MRPILRKEAAVEDGTATLDRTIAEAQNGSAEARESLVKAYLPFILKVASKVTRKYLRVGLDDEVSVGLMAFDEAITHYDSRKGKSFLSFSETVMRRRLADYFRRESQTQREIPFSSFAVEEDADEDDPAEFVGERQAILNHVSDVEAQERKEEIARFKNLLEEYGISFADLVEASPKHKDARMRAMQVAKLVATRPDLREYLIKKKNLPLAELARCVPVSRKTIERQRKYIIAIAIILLDEFVYLKEYVDRF